MHQKRMVNSMLICRISWRKLKRWANAEMRRENGSSRRRKVEKPWEAQARNESTFQERKSKLLFYKTLEMNPSTFQAKKKLTQTKKPTTGTNKFDEDKASISNTRKFIFKLTNIFSITNKKNSPMFNHNRSTLRILVKFPQTNINFHFLIFNLLNLPILLRSTFRLLTLRQLRDSQIGLGVRRQASGTPSQSGRRRGRLLHHQVFFLVLGSLPGRHERRSETLERKIKKRKYEEEGKVMGGFSKV